MAKVGRPKKDVVNITLSLPRKDAQELREYATIGKTTLSEAVLGLKYELYELYQENERLRTELDTLKATADL